MKMIIVLAALVAMALARPQHEKDVSILRYDNDNIGVGGYHYGYELSDGTSHDESAELKQIDKDESALVVHGTFKYIHDGVTYTVSYVADEEGFKPEGAHIPKI